MKEEIKEILEDHLDWLVETNHSETDRQIDYLSGLIAHRVGYLESLHRDIHGNRYDPKKVTDEQHDFSPDESQEYSEFAHLSTDRPEEITRDGDGKKLTERKVKSYGFFKNEYYDD